MRLVVVTVSCLALFFSLAACSGDDDTASGDTTTSSGTDVGRFCDVYLDYLADATPENLDAVEAAAGDEQVHGYIDAMRNSDDLTEVLAANLDLDNTARTRCQGEWTAGAQGAGNTPAAAQAFIDALGAGDPVGARNVASANAIAVFEPWEPYTANAPTIGDIDDGSFTIVLDPASLAECQVEAGVVVVCQIAE